MKKKAQDPDVFDFNTTAYLGKSSSFVEMGVPTAEILGTPTNPAENIPVENMPKMVPWGATNKLPLELVTKVEASPIVSTNMLFNVQMCYGGGVLPHTREIVNGKLVITPVYDNEQINEFFENNDINGYFLEQCTDMIFLYHAFPEIVFSVDGKIVELNSLEATFSRFSEIDAKTKKIEYHYYSAKWGEAPKKDDIIPTPLLSSKNPLRDLKERRGLIPNAKGITVKNPTADRFAMAITFPTPGKFYYQKPYWLSIITSGWYDYAVSLLSFKKALLKNGAAIWWHVQLSDNYWDVLYKAEKITDPEKQLARRAKELKDIDDFICGAENAGKYVLSYVRYVNDKEQAMMKLTPLDGKIKGGDYMGEMEEASNVQSYAMGVHPSLIGSSPGKNSTINGTEARELFIIKQALMKPFRDRLLLPLYIVKAINKWPANIFFSIQDIELTTLDAGTGSKKTIS